MWGEGSQFRGLAIVGVSELLLTPSQRHVVPVRARPGESKQPTGLLTLEFLGKDWGGPWRDCEVMPGVHRTFEAGEAARPGGARQVRHRVTAGAVRQAAVQVTHRTVYTRQGGAGEGGGRVADQVFVSTALLYLVYCGVQALRDIRAAALSRQARQPDKSCLLLHSVNAARSDRANKVSVDKWSLQDCDNVIDAGQTAGGTDYFHRYQL